MLAIPLREPLAWGATPTPTPAPSVAFDNTFSLDTVIQAVLALITLLGIVLSIWIARHGQVQDREMAKQEADRAENAQKASEASAERAEKASALTIDTLARMAEAVEDMSAATARMADRDPGIIVSGNLLAPSRVKWTLNHFNGDTYILENVGTATAYDVEVSAHESLLAPHEWPRVVEMPPGEAATFMAVRTMGTVDSTITVEWSGEAGGTKRESWRYPLPPRPPRR